MFTVLPIIAVLVGALATANVDNGNSPMGYPVSAVDQQIDKLGDERRVSTEKDALVLVEALLEKFDVDEVKLPAVKDFAIRLASAEFNTVRDPERRIPEATVCNAFNQLMERMGSPEFTRISIDEFRAFREVRAITLYPTWITREANGKLPPSLRPVEATYLLYLLYINGGVSQKMRVALSERGSHPQARPSASHPPDARLHAKRTNELDFRHRTEYWTSRSAYFDALGNDNKATLLQYAFELIGIN